MRIATALAVVALLGAAAPAWAAGVPSFAPPHTEVMDGLNGFPAGAYIAEDPFSTPNGCLGTGSDLIGESAAFVYYIADPLFQRVFLPAGGCMDIQDFWVAWDESTLFVAVRGPNELYERGDMFIAIDTDNATGASVKLASAPWAKRVDFCGWDPEYFIAIENPKTASGYAALLDQGFNVLIDSGTGLQWEDSGYDSCPNGMYYEFAIPLSLLGLSAGMSGQPVNFAVYTTYEDDGYDTYDTGPGCGQPGPWEQVGDVPFDGDHCGPALDCVTGANDISCGFTESDDTTGAGNTIGDREPSSDNSDSDVDTIQEYYSILNVGEIETTAVKPTTWGRVKTQHE